jgi:hypothetical protein
VPTGRWEKRKMIPGEHELITTVSTATQIPPTFLASSSAKVPAKLEMLVLSITI